MTPSKQDVVTVDIVRKALSCKSMTLSHFESLSEEDKDRITSDCPDAIDIISDNQAEFDELLWNRISQLPLFKSHFRQFIRARLQQNDFLASELLQIAFDDNPVIEQRLSRIQCIDGVESWSQEFRPPKSSVDGLEIENKARELLAEVLVLDFLIQLEFEDIKKLPRDASKAQIDVLCRRADRLYAIEITRKREISEWAPLNSGIPEDCANKNNNDRISSLITKALSKKNDQFRRALRDVCKERSAVRVVAIKTSDYGFAECIKEATAIARKLLREPGNWSFIDCIWLIPNINPNQSVWIFKNNLDHIAFSETMELS